MASNKSAVKKEVDLSYLREQILPDEAAYRQITRRLREMILSRELPEGTRFPSIKRLAEMLQTNYFTVQTALSPLVNEGLLLSRQRRGTIVANNQKQIRTIGIYYGASFFEKQRDFYRSLYSVLVTQLREREMESQLFVDERSHLTRSTTWPPLVKAIESGQVHAVFATMLSDDEVKWLRGLNIPLTMMHSSDFPQCLGMDSKIFMQTSVKRLKDRGCHKVGLIHPGGHGAARELELFLELCKQLDLISIPAWQKRSEMGSGAGDFEEFGFDQFKEIWSHQERPDGLIVTPDLMARGAVLAILEKGVRVPQDIRLIFHCNEDIPFHCPFPVDWQVVSAKTIAAGAIKHLLSQAHGKKPVRLLMSAYSLHPSTIT